MSVRKFIDLFAGCGGLSLGMTKAGWRGCFAIEKNQDAFSTFKHNLINKSECFDWPGWLDKKAMTIEELLDDHAEELGRLSGKIDAIVGGPPCQGFSIAGLRQHDDPRNQLANKYLKLVEITNPRVVLLENVKGFNAKFAKAQKAVPYSKVFQDKLEGLGYVVTSSYVNSARFGVPQNRERFLMIGLQKTNSDQQPFSVLNDLREQFLIDKNLQKRPITVSGAIKDLETLDKQLVYHSGPQSNPFYKIDYVPPKIPNAYLRLLRAGKEKVAPNSLRLPRHKAETIKKFKNIQKNCESGCQLNKKQRAKLKIRKHSTGVLDGAGQARTLTTLPDDLLHYSEPRILTVRESARLQSFPDSFEFLGKYTTGGKERTSECPRYSQVGNAVPPLLAEVLGKMLAHLLNIQEAQENAKTIQS